MNLTIDHRSLLIWIFKVKYCFVRRLWNLVLLWLNEMQLVNCVSVLSHEWVCSLTALWCHRWLISTCFQLFVCHSCCAVDDVIGAAWERKHSILPSHFTPRQPTSSHVSPLYLTSVCDSYCISPASLLTFTHFVIWSVMSSSCQCSNIMPSGDRALITCPMVVVLRAQRRWSNNRGSQWQCSRKSIGFCSTNWRAIPGWSS